LTGAISKPATVMWRPGLTVI